MLEPIKRTRLYEEVIEQILGLIKNGSLSPGDRLPTERELAGRLNVSRTSVREALRSMEMMGYIESRVGINGGTFIKEFTIDDIIGPLTRLLNSYKKTESVFEFIEARIILESATAKLAARRRDEEDIRQIHETLLFMEREIEKGQIGLVGDHNFHVAVAKSTHNQVLMKIANMLEGLLADSRRATLEIPGIPREALDDHRNILEAIRKKSEKEAVALMKAHLRKAYDKLPNNNIDFDM
jgi:GntR family transcriptional repressor for pyruvate dehydrogenase complex